MASGALLAMSLAGGAVAHQLDEYLQATLIGVTRNGVEVEIQLTPGVAVLPVVLAAIDRDGDGRIAAEEERAYANRVAQEVELRLDGAPAALSLIESEFPQLEEMRQGLGTIRLKLRARRAGRELHFENRHLPQVSAYLVNCLAAPGEGLSVGPQERDEAQRSIRFEYSFGRQAGRSAVRWEQGSFLVGAVAMLLVARLAVCGYSHKSWWQPDRRG
jgi:hypothetical protein